MGSCSTRWTDPARPIIDLRPIASLRGAHNWQNAAAAYGAVRALGLEPTAIAAGLPRFEGLAHRLEHVATLDGVQFVNDSKATNPDAAARALASFDRIYWIAGGRPKEGGLDALLPWLDRVRHAYLIGEAAESFAHALAGRVPCTHSGDLASAVRQAAGRGLGGPGRRRRRPPHAGVRVVRPVPRFRGPRRDVQAAGRRTPARPGGRECRLVIRVSRTERGLLARWWWTIDHAAARGPRAARAERPGFRPRVQSARRPPAWACRRCTSSVVTCCF